MHREEAGVIYHSGCKDADVSVAKVLDVINQLVQRMTFWYLLHIRDKYAIHTHADACSGAMGLPNV